MIAGVISVTCMVLEDLMVGTMDGTNETNGIRVALVTTEIIINSSILIVRGSGKTIHMEHKGKMVVLRSRPETWTTRYLDMCPQNQEN
jgi:hypothetical protein